MLQILSGFIERYYIEVQIVGYDKNHVHIYVGFHPSIKESDK